MRRRNKEYDTYASVRNIVNMKRTQMLNSVNKSGVVESSVTAGPFFSIFSILTASEKPEE